jgi:hypothetical protein
MTSTYQTTTPCDDLKKLEIFLKSPEKHPPPQWDQNLLSTSFQMDLRNPFDAWAALELLEV